MSTHVDVDGDCPLAIVPCQYTDIGCKFKVRATCYRCYIQLSSYFNYRSIFQHKQLESESLNEKTMQINQLKMRERIQFFSNINIVLICQDLFSVPELQFFWSVPEITPFG